MKPVVAVIDDNETVCLWVKAALEQAGYEVVTYTNSFGIQAFVRKSKPVALVLDVNMPALSGPVICNLLKDDPKTSSLAIILYSGMDVDSLRNAAKACRADAYVRKSEDAGPLVKQLRSLSPA